MDQEENTTWNQSSIFVTQIARLDELLLCKELTLDDIFSFRRTCQFLLCHFPTDDHFWSRKLEICDLPNFSCFHEEGLSFSTIQKKFSSRFPSWVDFATQIYFTSQVLKNGQMRIDLSLQSKTQLRWKTGTRPFTKKVRIHFLSLLSFSIVKPFIDPLLNMVRKNTDSMMFLLTEKSRQNFSTQSLIKRIPSIYQEVRASLESFFQNKECLGIFVFFPFISCLF